jgi:hypothetical protein
MEVSVSKNRKTILTPQSKSKKRPPPPRLWGVKYTVEADGAPKHILVKVGPTRKGGWATYPFFKPLKLLNYKL